MTSRAASTAPIWPASLRRTGSMRTEAHEVAHDLAYRLAKAAYKL